MQYLQSQPFSVGLASKKFSEGWDRIFAKKREEKTESTTEQPEQMKQVEKKTDI